MHAAVLDAATPCTLCAALQVLRLKNDIGQWVNKHNKHISVSPANSTTSQPPAAPLSWRP
jgi:hypothetical protein